MEKELKFNNGFWDETLTEHIRNLLGQKLKIDNKPHIEAFSMRVKLANITAPLSIENILHAELDLS